MNADSVSKKKTKLSLKYQRKFNRYYQLADWYHRALMKINKIETEDDYVNFKQWKSATFPGNNNFSLSSKEDTE